MSISTAATPNLITQPRQIQNLKKFERRVRLTPTSGVVFHSQ